MDFEGCGPNSISDLITSQCRHQQGRSPINIDTSTVQKVTDCRPLRLNYFPIGHPILSNVGHTWKLKLPPNSCQSITGGPLLDQTFELESIHCHWTDCNVNGSEHSVNGHLFSGELHLVHFNRKYTKDDSINHTDGTAVVGVFLSAEDSSENVELAKITQCLDQVKYKDDSHILPIAFDPMGLFPIDKSYWCYKGSLTTEPAKPVLWIVMCFPVDVSVCQLKEMRELKEYGYREYHQHNYDKDYGCMLGNNNRRAHSLGRRVVYQIDHKKSTKKLKKKDDRKCIEV